MLMYGRNAIDQQPPLMIELTGGGKTLFKELVDRFGWMHFYQHFEQVGMTLEETDKFGWTPTGTTVRQLWHKGKQLLVNVKDRRVILRSKPLVNEMRVCQDDNIYVSMMTRGKAKEGSGRHDDLVYSAMFNLWQANLFNLTPSGTTTSPVHMTVASQPNVPFSARDMTPEERQQFWAEWDNRVMGGATINW
jgi:hypothetical protein